MDHIDEVLCGFINEGKRWESLSGEDWVSVLGKDQYFVEKCDSVNGWGLFSGICWVRLLIDYPEFENRCNQHKGWDKFDIGDWIRLINKHPEFAKKKCRQIACSCDLNDLLEECPDFAKVYPLWEKLSSEDWHKISIYGLLILLAARPDLANVYPLWDNLGAEAWISVLDECPRFVEKCDEVKGWARFDGRSHVYYDEEEKTYWARILAKHPEWNNRCDKFNGWDKFGRKDWGHLLQKQPQFFQQCDKVCGWKNFNGSDWVRLLQKRPQLSQLCDKVCDWKNFNGFDWVELLREQPMFSDKCDVFDGWRKIDFTAISLHNNEYIVHGMILDDKGNKVKISKIIKCSVVIGHDDFIIGDIEEDEYCYYGEDKEIVSCSKNAPPFCGRWAELLERQPQFAVKCDEYNGWEIFDGFDWFRLLSEQSCFVEKCNILDGWKKLFYYRPDVYRCSVEDSPDYISEYAHRKLYEIPDEYEYDFDREHLLAANACLNGVPVDCWLHRVKKIVEHDQLSPKEPDILTCDVGAIDAYRDHLTKQNDKDDNCLRYGQISLPEGEILILKRGLKSIFWVYLLNQSPVFAILLAAQHGINKVWATLTLDEWQIAIKERSCFIDSLKELNRKGCQNYTPRDDFFDEEFWDDLIGAWPDFFENLGCCEAEAWSYLVCHRPEWAVYMKNKDWARFKENDWVKLLDPYWQFLAKTTTVLDDCFWWNCLSTAPSLADICEQNHGWGELSNNQLVGLMTMHDELISFCVKYLKWDTLTYDDWMRIIAKRPQYAREYIAKCISSEDNKQTETEVITKAKEHIAQTAHKKYVSSIKDDTWYDDYSDWREASGWNDVYGSSVEASDIIEFRD